MLKIQTTDSLIELADYDFSIGIDYQGVSVQSYGFIIHPGQIEKLTYEGSLGWIRLIVDLFNSEKEAQPFGQELLS